MKHRFGVYRRAINGLPGTAVSLHLTLLLMAGVLLFSFPAGARPLPALRDYGRRPVCTPGTDLTIAFESYQQQLEEQKQRQEEEQEREQQLEQERQAEQERQREAEQERERAEQERERQAERQRQEEQARQREAELRHEREVQKQQAERARVPGTEQVKPTRTSLTERQTPVYRPEPQRKNGPERQKQSTRLGAERVLVKMPRPAVNPTPHPAVGVGSSFASPASGLAGGSRLPGTGLRLPFYVRWGPPITGCGTPPPPLQSVSTTGDCSWTEHNVGGLVQAAHEDTELAQALGVVASACFQGGTWDGGHGLGSSDCYGGPCSDEPSASCSQAMDNCDQVGVQVNADQALHALGDQAVADMQTPVAGRTYPIPNAVLDPTITEAQWNCEGTNYSAFQEETSARNQLAQWHQATYDAWVEWSDWAMRNSIQCRANAQYQAQVAVQQAAYQQCQQRLAQQQARLAQQRTLVAQQNQQFLNALMAQNNAVAQAETAQLQSLAQASMGDSDTATSSTSTNTDNNEGYPDDAGNGDDSGTDSINQDLAADLQTAPAPVTSPLVIPPIPAQPAANSIQNQVTAQPTSSGTEAQSAPPATTASVQPPSSNSISDSSDDTSSAGNLAYCVSSYSQNGLTYYVNNCSQPVSLVYGSGAPGAFGIAGIVPGASTCASCGLASPATQLYVGACPWGSSPVNSDGSAWAPGAAPYTCSSDDSAT
jgi:hypothetical protein